MAARTITPKPSTAVVPALMSPDELQQLLEQSGMAPKASNAKFRRMVAQGGLIITDKGQPDEETWPPVKNGPVMTVQIVKPPVYYNAFFLKVGGENGAIDPNVIGRPDLDKKFVKKYDDPAEQAADEWSNVDVYDDLQKYTGKRGKFAADIQLRILPESGEFTGEEPIYTLTLSTTSALDFRGTTSNPQGGIVQEKNFITQLGELAQTQALEAGAKPEELATAVLSAMTALTLGGVVAEIYLIQTTNPERPAQPYTVTAFKPIYIETGTALEALASGAEETNGLETDPDDIPF